MLEFMVRNHSFDRRVHFVLFLPSSHSYFHFAMFQALVTLKRAGKSLTYSNRKDGQLSSRMTWSTMFFS